MPHGASLQDWLPIRHLAVRGRNRAIDWQASLLGWGPAVWFELIKELQLNSNSRHFNVCLVIKLDVDVKRHSSHALTTVNVEQVTSVKILTHTEHRK